MRYKEFLTPKLYDFVSKSLESTKNSPGKKYSFEELLLVAQHAVGNLVKVYGGLNEQLHATLNDSTDSPEEKKQREQLSQLLLEAGKLYMGELDKLANITKKAAEIDAIVSSKFDGVQVIHCIEQLVEIIEEVITAELGADYRYIAEKIATEFTVRSQHITAGPQSISESSRGLERDISEMLASVPRLGVLDSGLAVEQHKANDSSMPDGCDASREQAVGLNEADILPDELESDIGDN